MKEGKGIILERGVGWIKLHRVPLTLGDRLVEVLRKELGTDIVPADDWCEDCRSYVHRPECGNETNSDLAGALSNLLRQVEAFAEENGEADFFTARARAALLHQSGKKPQAANIMALVRKLPNLHGEDFFATRDAIQAALEQLDEECVHQVNRSPLVALHALYQAVLGIAPYPGALDEAMDEASKELARHPANESVAGKKP